MNDMLEGFRGRCKFRQYITNLIIWYKDFYFRRLVCIFTVNIEIYAGKQPIWPFLQNNGEAVITLYCNNIVKRMIKPIAKTSCNITIDNCFTSVPLAVELLKDYTTRK